MSRPRGVPRQSDVFEALRAYQSTIGKTPSVRILSEMTGIPRESVRIFLNRLDVEDGLIYRKKGYARDIQIVASSKLGSVNEKYVKKALALQDAHLKKKDAKKMNKAEAGKQGKGADAFTPKISNDAVDLQKRIDKVVQDAKNKEGAFDGEDVMLNRSKPYNRRLRVHVVRIA